MNIIPIAIASFISMLFFLFLAIEFWEDESHNIWGKYLFNFRYESLIFLIFVALTLLNLYVLIQSILELLK